MNYAVISILIASSRRSSRFSSSQSTSFISASQVDNSFVEYTKENMVVEGDSTTQEWAANIPTIADAKSLLSKNIVNELSTSQNKSKDLDTFIDQITSIVALLQNEKNDTSTQAQAYLAKYEECKSQKSTIDTQFYQELNNWDITKSKSLLSQSAVQAECVGQNRVHYNWLAQITNTLDAYITALQNKKTVLQSYYNTIISQTESLDQTTIDKLQTTVNDLNATTLWVDG